MEEGDVKGGRSQAIRGRDRGGGGRLLFRFNCSAVDAVHLYMCVCVCVDFPISRSQTLAAVFHLSLSGLELWGEEKREPPARSGQRRAARHGQGKRWTALVQSVGLKGRPARTHINSHCADIHMWCTDGDC